MSKKWIRRARQLSNNQARQSKLLHYFVYSLELGNKSCFSTMKSMKTFGKHKTISQADNCKISKKAAFCGKSMKFGTDIV